MKWALLFLFAGAPLAHADLQRGDADDSGRRCQSYGSLCRRHWEFARRIRREADAAMQRTARQGADRSVRGYGRSGQQNGTALSAEGYRNLARNAAGIVSRFEARAREVAEAQRTLATESYSQNPGSANPEAVRFHQANQQGEAPSVPDFSSPNPTVSAQAAAYNHLGETRRVLEQEARTFRTREQEFQSLASSTGANASRMENKEEKQAGGESPAGGGAPGGGQGNSPSSSPASTIAEQLPKEQALAQSRKGTDNELAGPENAGAEKSEKSANAATAPTKSAGGLTLGGRGSGLGDANTDRLRESLRAGQTYRPAQASSSSASGEGGVEGSGAAIDPKAEAEHVAKGQPGGAAPAAEGAGNAGGDEALSPFGKPLSDPKFSLAGSETDASVKQMEQELMGDENAEEGGRGLASEEMPDGIGAKYSASLFERVRAFHDRCAKNGCVSGMMKRKMGGT